MKAGTRCAVRHLCVTMNACYVDRLQVSVGLTCCAHVRLLLGGASVHTPTEPAGEAVGAPVTAGVAAGEAGKVAAGDCNVTDGDAVAVGDNTGEELLAV